jgi:hypothetical protein
MGLFGRGKEPEVQVEDLLAPGERIIGRVDGCLHWNDGSGTWAEIVVTTKGLRRKLGRKWNLIEFAGMKNYGCGPLLGAGAMCVSFRYESSRYTAFENATELNDLIIEARGQ